MEKDCGCGCIGSIIISIIIGIVVGIIYFFNVASMLIIGTWIVIGIATSILLVLLIAGLFCNNECLCNANCLVIAAIGTIITSILALTMFFDLLTVTILIGFIAFFFSFMIIELISLFGCLFRKKCCFRK